MRKKHLGKVLVTASLALIMGVVTACGSDKKEAATNSPANSNEGTQASASPAATPEASTAVPLEKIKIKV